MNGSTPHCTPRDHKHGSAGSFFRSMAVGLALVGLSACSALRPTASPATAFYALDRTPLPTAAATPALPEATVATVTLLINPPHAAAGFDSSRIIYLREPHKLDYFAQSQWVDAPARMLGPLLVAAIEKTGAFQAVVLMPGAATGDVRLDTDLIRLQHEFQGSPSQVRLTVRATLVDERSRRVLAWQEFEATEPASSEDAYGGVLAANLAVQRVVAQLARFAAATAAEPRTWPTTP